MKFRVLSDSTVEVASLVSEYFDPVIIPSEVLNEGEKYKVVGIGDEAFARSRMTSIEIPSTVTYIGIKSFFACNLSSIVIPSSVTVVGSNAFEYCQNLREVILPDSISLDFEAFYDCAIDSIVITSGSSVGNRCFSENSFLKKVVFNQGVTHIGSKAFLECDELTKVEIPNSVSRIGSYAFAGCGKLDVVIDNSKDSVYVGEWTFEGCKSVKYLRDAISAEVDVVDAASSLFQFEILTDSTVEVKSAMKSDTMIIPAKVRIEDNVYDVASIGEYVFAGASFIKLLEIPSSVKVIGEGAFRECRGFKEVKIPSGVKSIGEGAFCDCEDLTSVSISSSVTKIAVGAFYHCENLNVVIDNSRDNVLIDDVAFSGCKSIKFTDESALIDSSVVDAMISPLKFTPTSDSTVSVSGWISPYSNKCLLVKGIDIPTRVQIGSEIYTVTSIGAKAFERCAFLSSVKIPSTVNDIGGSSFESSSLESVELPSKAEIGYGAFMSCYKLKSVFIPAKVYIGHNAFQYSGLETVVFEEGLDYIGKNSFMGCSSLTKVVIPSSVKYIRMGAFYECDNLEVEVDNSMDNIQFDVDYGSDIPYDPFAGCKSVKYAK